MLSLCKKEQSTPKQTILRGFLGGLTAKTNICGMVKGNDYLNDSKGIYLRYHERKEGVIDFNPYYMEYINELVKKGFSLFALGQAIGLHPVNLYKFSYGAYTKNLRLEHIFKLGIVTGYHFDFGRYTYLMPSKDDLIKELETLQPTKKHNKNK